MIRGMQFIFPMGGGKVKHTQFFCPNIWLKWLQHISEIVNVSCSRWSRRKAPNQQGRRNTNLLRFWQQRTWMVKPLETRHQHLTRYAQVVIFFLPHQYATSYMYFPYFPPLVTACLHQVTFIYKYHQYKLPSVPFSLQTQARLLISGPKLFFAHCLCHSGHLYAYTLCHRSGDKRLTPVPSFSFLVKANSSILGTPHFNKDSDSITHVR